MDFFVVLERPGFRVSRRRKCQRKVGRSRKLTKTDAMKWFQQNSKALFLLARTKKMDDDSGVSGIAQKSQKSIIIVFSRDLRYVER